MGTTRSTSSRRLRAPSLLAFALAACAQAFAHPFHASVAEADYRRDTGKLEIAIRLFTDDAETMLSQRASKKIAFAKTPAAELDAQLLAATRESFVVTTSDGTPQPLNWVGRELKDRDQHVWIYVECVLPGGIAGARLAHRMLHDTFSDQLNSIRLRDHGPPLRQVTLFFTAQSEPAVVFARK